MTNDNEPRRIKCPHCGWRCSIDEQGRIDTGRADVTRGKDERGKNPARRIRSLRVDAELEEAKSWLDVDCPHCRGSFQYNVRTGKVRK